MKIVFFGTPQFATPFLRTLIHDEGFEVAAIVTQTDKPVGRKGELKPPAVKTEGEEHGVPVLQPESLKNDAIAAELAELKADAFVVVAYGKLIPKNILDIPPLGCINVHPSLLPKYRGPSPMQWAIAEGDSVTGISIMLLDEGMDTGPVLAFETIELDGDETYTSLQSKAENHGPRLLLETLKRHNEGAITPVPQNDADASVTRLLKREDGRVDWSEPMTLIERKSRAYAPWPGLWSVWKRGDEEIRLKFHALSPSDDKNDLSPGTVLIKNNRLFVDCADGTLEMLEIQPEGKPKMTAEEFLKGYSDVSGAVLL